MPIVIEYTVGTALRAHAHIKLNTLSKFIIKQAKSPDRFLSFNIQHTQKVCPNLNKETRM